MTTKLIAMLFAATFLAACGSATFTDTVDPQRGNAERSGSSSSGGSGGASSEGEGPR